MKQKVMFAIMMLISTMGTVFAQKCEFRYEFTREKSEVIRWKLDSACNHIYDYLVTYVEMQKTFWSEDGIWKVAPNMRAELTLGIVEKLLSSHQQRMMLEEKRISRITRLFGTDHYSVKYAIVKNGIIQRKVKIEPRQIDKTMLIGFIICSGILLLIYFFGFLYHDCIKSLRQVHTILMPLVFIWLSILLHFSPLHLILDAGILLAILTFPSLILLLLAFRKRQRKQELKSQGYLMDEPLHIFDDGSIVVKNTERTSDPKTCSVHFFDKKYRLLDPQPYNMVCGADEDETRIVRKWTHTYGLIDASWNVLLPVEYDEIGPPFEGMRFLRKGYKKWGYYNSLTNVIIPMRYNEASPFANGIARVAIGRDVFYINKEGKEVDLPQPKK